MFVLPLFLFLALFAVDMGRVMLAYGALSDATYVAARSAAQAGNSGPLRGDSKAAFSEALSQVPGIDDASGAELVIVNGNCTLANTYVQMTGTKKFTFITPGLGQILGAFTKSSGSSFGGAWTMNAKAVVLCEVVTK